MTETDSFGPRHVAELHMIAYLDRSGVLSLRATNEFGDVVTARGAVHTVARQLADMTLESASAPAKPAQGHDDPETYVPCPPELASGRNTGDASDDCG